MERNDGSFERLHVSSKKGTRLDLLRRKCLVRDGRDEQSVRRRRRKKMLEDLGYGSLKEDAEQILLHIH